MALEIFKQSMTDKTKGTIIAMVILFAFVFWMGTFYPEVAKMGDVYTELMENPAMKALIGNSVATLTTFEGFMSIELFSYMGLIFGGYVAFLAASFIAGEIEQKTGDLLFSLPVSRTDIVVSRFAVIAIISVLITAAMIAGAVLSAMYINVSVSLEHFGYMMLFTSALTIAAGSIAMLISTFLSDSKQAALASLGVFILMYFTETIGSTVEGLNAIRSLSLFHYVSASDILVSHNVEWIDLGVLIAVAVVFLALSVVNFNRRDINFG